MMHDSKKLPETHLSAIEATLVGTIVERAWSIVRSERLAFDEVDRDHKFLLRRIVIGLVRERDGVLSDYAELAYDRFRDATATPALASRLAFIGD